KQADSSKNLFKYIDTNFIPYIHQRQAWERISTSQQAISTLIATGTSSGKTECFLYPILDHCLNSSEDGIKAIIIYPMNALATDQARRFAEAIAALKDEKKKIRVGLYIGESEENPTKIMTADGVITDKNVIKNNPPDVLLTNYKMLDFLMIRPGDQALWQNNAPTTLRYLVVDELHTFDGAQGTDLACLIRRLKAKLGTPRDHLVCVGTSATLGSKGEDGESGKEGEPLRLFAQRIFQEKFDRQSIIGESRQSVSEFLNAIPITYTFLPVDELEKKLEPLNYDSVSEYLKAQYALFFPGQSEADVNNPKWCCVLGEQLKQHLLFYNLLQLLVNQPVELESIINEIAKVLPVGEAQSQSEAIFNSLCALIALSRLQDSNNPERILPLVNLRMQLWVRELRRMVAPLRGDSPLKGDSNDEYESDNTNNHLVNLSFADDHKNEQQKIYLPVVQCNTCHSTAWLAVKPKEQQHIQNDLRSIYNAFFQNSPDSVILFPINHDDEFSSRGYKKTICTSCGHLQTGNKSCIACGEEYLQEVFIPDTIKEKTIKGAPRLVSEPYCPVCDSYNSLIIFGARATNLSSIAIQHDFASVYNNDKKMITFSDSVQDAAHRAGFFSARTWQNNIRMAMAQALPESTIPLQEFYQYFPDFWQDKELNPSALDSFTFISEFIAPNMQWFRDYVYLIEKEQLPPESNLIESIIRRLHWEVLAEFGFRSRIGRSLEQVGIAGLGIDIEPVQSAIDNIVQPLREQLGLHNLTDKNISDFVWGFLFYLNRRGAIYHAFLNAYIGSGGKTFLLNKQSYLPSFARQTRAPLFLLMNNKGTEFDGILLNKGESWYQKWCKKTLGQNGLFPDKFEANIYGLVINALLDEQVLTEHECKGEAVWGLNPELLFISQNTVRLQTPNSKDYVVIPDSLLHIIEGMPSLISSDVGLYEQMSSHENELSYNKQQKEHWLAQLYRRGDLCRVIAQEHTGLLERERREQVEYQFIHGEQPWYPNLLSATPTLEMGINIGDLSSVLLASVPPAQANYLQRIGRAGRK
ncbi:MAG: DEAD/DEAH box helicase, partial [Thiotrichaceae bacterium]|nr:DEAD/DEAH box helicase [Thiotrichaceae bacterium]